MNQIKKSFVVVLVNFVKIFVNIAKNNANIQLQFCLCNKGTPYIHTHCLQVSIVYIYIIKILCLDSSQDLNPQSLHLYPHQVLKSEMWSQVFIWQGDEGSTV